MTITTQTNVDFSHLALQSDGRIVVAGTASSSSGIALARHYLDGSLDQSFSGDGLLDTYFIRKTPSDFATNLTVQQDGKILVVGSANNAFAISRFNSDGTLDTGFGIGGTAITPIGSDGVAEDVIVQPDGKIVVAGTVSIGFGLVRFNANGSLDNSFDNDGIVATDFFR